MNCPSCAKPVNPKSTRCNYCNTILVSKSSFKKTIKNRKEKSAKEEKKDFIKSGRNTLLIVGGLNTLPIFMYLSQSDDLSAIIQGVIAAIFLGLGLLANKAPYAALLSGIIMYFLIIGLAAIGDPASIAHGLIVKAIVIFYLFKGMMAAQKFKKKYKNNDLLDDVVM